MKILVIAEHDNKKIKPSTLSTISAGLKIDDNIEMLIFSTGSQEIVSDSEKISGLKKVTLIKHEIFESQIAEDITKALTGFLESGEYTHILAPSTTFGKNLLPRIAAHLDVQQISDIMTVLDHETFERPIYAGNAVCKLKSKDKIKVITVRGTCFEPCKKESKNTVEVIDSSLTFDGKVNFVKHELSESDRPELTAAKIVISGGRGMQNGDNFKLLEGIADKLGAAIGASRAAVDAGFVPNDWQVGQTGKIVAPDLYIAVGISGAIQHIAGIKDSKFIVAINKDEEAPIFKFSDYGLVGDLFEVLPALEQKL
jgi:electron transfer flavoprotein alpha subunit|tara:strand:+ start:201 stop:1136 length:936 start_codon:yes stop_codon:yes gene_type:complete